MSHREAPSCNGSQQESQKLTGDAAGETPRTDAYIAKLESELGDGPPCVSTAAVDICVRVSLIALARQLERESSSLKAQLEGFRKAIRDAARGCDKLPVG
jgi:hypothetical protein